MGDKRGSGNQRSDKDRRDWDEFVIHNRRLAKDRRTSKDRRRQQQPFEGSDRRRSSLRQQERSSNSLRQPIGKPVEKKPARKVFYTTIEAAEQTGISQPTLMLWIRNNVIDDSKIKRDSSGRRIWREKDLDMIRKIKKSEGWH